MSAADHLYDGALRRLTNWILILSILGIPAAGLLRGPRAAGGFLVGAAISLASFYSWKRFAERLGEAPGNSRSSPAFAAMMGARYLIAAGIIYAIVKVSGIALGAVFVGLLVSLAAAFLEILYELTVFLKH